MPSTRIASDSGQGRFVDELQRIVGREHCLSDPAELFVYGSDALTLDPGSPSVVVLPGSTEEVSAVIRACRAANRAFVPRGAGTGLSGGAQPADGAVIISCMRMGSVLEIDEFNRLAVIQPGVVNADLSKEVEHLGLFYAPDPSSQQACTVGGNVAENSGGPHTLKYGTTTNHILALEMVLPDGTITRLGSASGFSVGYDLVGAVVGSEGTLGVVTEMTVRLTEIPEATETALVIFDDVPSACRLVGRVIRSGMVPAALEVVDQRTVVAVEASVYAAGLPVDAGAVLIVELDGARCELPGQLLRIREMAEQEGAREVSVAQSPEERTHFWRARKGAFGAMGRLAPDLYVHDAVVPRARLPEVLEGICEIGDRYSLTLSNIFHAGDGNLHPNISYDRRDEEELKRVIAAGKEMLELCVKVGGVLTGEHGVGIEKRDYMGLLFDDADLSAMLRLRNTFNPDGFCNPGKLIPTPRACTEANPKARGYDTVPIR
ncbi:MAG: FAD-linked oxidase C-terminal domain-containing protein [Myxococcota bacterium]|nr:FAD-linked oxidase C-terminal domain-containing protein [Myxococcota bacterium]